VLKLILDEVVVADLFDLEFFDLESTHKNVNVAITFRVGYSRKTAFVRDSTAEPKVTCRSLHKSLRVGKMLNLYNLWLTRFTPTILTVFTTASTFYVVFHFDQIGYLARGKH